MDLIVAMAGNVLDQCYGTSSGSGLDLPCAIETPVDDPEVPERNGNVRRVKGPANFQSLSNSDLLFILSYLSLPDILFYRFVCKRWNELITSSSSIFLSRLVFRVADEASYDIFRCSTVGWQNVTFNLPEVALKVTSEDRLKNIRLLQLELCTFSFETLVKLRVEHCPSLEHLVLTDCIIKPPEDPPPWASLNIKRLSLCSSKGLGTILNLISYQNSHPSPLEHLSITYVGGNDPTPEIIEHFNTELLELLAQNETTLRSLTLNLRNTELLSGFCTRGLGAYDGTLSNLEEFQLSPWTAEEEEVDMPVCHANTQILVNFLCRHESLKRVSLPHFVGCCNEAKRRRIFRSLPPKIQVLHLAGHSYLVPEFLTRLPGLRRLSLGSSSCRAFHPNALRYSPAVCQNIEALEIHTRIHLSPGKLGNFAWKFPALTKLEFDAFRPLVNDFDLQAIIINCRWLRSLSIADCDCITDFGLTGAPLEWCAEVFRLGIIYTSTPERIPSRGNFRPITTLKGLTVLKLSGHAKFSDVGVFYGLRFLELRHLCLPLSDQITGWGLQRLGDWNPSLESLSLSGTDVISFDALRELCSNHHRLSLDNVSVDRWYRNGQGQQRLSTSSPSMLTAAVTTTATK